MFVNESLGDGMNDDSGSRWFEGGCERTDYGDRLLLLTSDQKRYLITLSPKNSLHTHLGIYRHVDLSRPAHGQHCQKPPGP